MAGDRAEAAYEEASGTCPDEGLTGPPAMLSLFPMSIPAHHEEPAGRQDAPETSTNPVLELREHLLKAATLAAELNVDLDAFMRSAWQAYMEARPGLREHLEDLELVARIEELRKAGKIGAA